MADNSRTFTIPSALVEYILLGPADDQRQLQDSPILGDVWLAYAAAPASIQDLLITPHSDLTAAQVAGAISDRFESRVKHDKDERWPGTAYLQGIVAVQLSFDEVLSILVPMTLWWHNRDVWTMLRSPNFHPEKLVERMARIFSADAFVDAKTQASTFQEDFTALERYVALAGLILWAAVQELDTQESLSAEQVLRRVEGRTEEVLGGLLQMFSELLDQHGENEPEGTIFQVSLNRRVLSALDKSVPAVKADAARTLFQVDCNKITWAVLDSGIDSTHDALKTKKGQPRVKKTLDFTRVRRILSSDNRRLSKEQLRTLVAGLDIGVNEARNRLDSLAEDAKRRRPVDWDTVDDLISMKRPPAPRSAHGTHVAGIIGADRYGNDEDSGYDGGMCPGIRLYDFRVLGKTMEDTEFAVIAALQYIRYINDQHNYLTIHGANLSLSIPHNVRNYACGRTPVCVECEKLIDSGVVVVAAAGNRGYQHFETKDGIFEGYAAFSITDPGNADGVITVGATHGNWPHTYGVSFFSSRGPTGDGRLKPDLVAPGERVQAPILNNEWGHESGTSMAAPHVSGAAAMLMSRYPELVGQPRRIKRILCESATDLGRERSFQGYGMLDVLRAFQSI